MLLVKEEKFMPNHEATIERNNDKASLVLSIDSKQYKIALTEDNPREIKKIFNQLIIELKKGKFNFTLSDKTQDLYHHICKEYIKQLNVEIADVYSQLKKNNLLST